MKHFFLYCACACMLFVPRCFVYPQAEIMKISKSSTSSLNACIADFDIEKVNFKHPVALRHADLLRNYFICRAAAQDSRRPCDSAAVPGECVRKFDLYWGFYGRLIAQGNATPQMLRACASHAGKQEAEGAKDGCRLLAQAVLTGDKQLWEGLTNRRQQAYLKAYGSMNSSACPDKSCRDTVLLLKAIKSVDIRICDGIKKDYIRWICRGGVGQDESQCRNSKEFKEFISQYCKDKIRSGRIQKEEQ